MSRRPDFAKLATVSGPRLAIRPSGPHTTQPQGRGRKILAPARSYAAEHGSLASVTSATVHDGFAWDSGSALGLALPAEGDALARLREVALDILSAVVGGHGCPSGC
jgi:hypothetical protein